MSKEIPNIHTEWENKISKIPDINDKVKQLFLSSEETNYQQLLNIAKLHPEELHSNLDTISNESIVEFAKNLLERMGKDIPENNPDIIHEAVIYIVAHYNAERRRLESLQSKIQ